MALDKLESFLGVSLVLGFSFITISLVSGAFVGQNPVSQMQGSDVANGLVLKIVWAISVWIWYLLILVAKNILLKPAKRISQMSLIGFFLLTCTAFGQLFFS